jgi:hypothetical protein
VDEVEAATAALVHPNRLWSRAECISRPSPMPAAPGLYAWFFRELPPGVDATGCAQFGDCTLLYLGIAPTRAMGRNGLPSRNSLRSRIRMHYAGSAEGSTLRLTLGALLVESLGLRRRAGSSKSFGEGERKLSEWMGQNAYVAWIVRPEPWVIEPSVIGRLFLPFNLAHNRYHPFHDQLAAARARLGLATTLETDRGT